MNSVSADARLQRLEAFLAQDPHNLTLLADTADAALSAGVLTRADALTELGLQLSADEAGWRFRQASLRIAQRKLDEAKAILDSMAAVQGAQAAVVHNLAYIEFLQGHHAECAARLAPWLMDDANDAAAAQLSAIQALWLRAMHGSGALDEAWAWSQERLHAGKLSAVAAGVASLIALDLSQLEPAASLSQQALDAGIRDLEPLVARAGVALAVRDTQLAARLLQEALTLSPDDARAWSGLGLVAMWNERFADARHAFETALKPGPQVEFLQGLAWACVMTHDLPAASAALDQAIALDPAVATTKMARLARALVNGEPVDGAELLRAARLR